MKVMSKRCLQIITALLCVLLLAGCGAAPAKEDDTTRTAPRTQPAQTDNAPTQRGNVMPDVSCQVEWGEGVQPDQVIGDAAQAYFTLLGTALSAPEQPAQSDPSCTDALVQEAYLRGFMSSDLLYPHVELRVRINRLTFPTPETARAEIYLNCEVLSCLDISGRSNDESKQGFGDDHVVTLAETDAGWIVTGDDSEKSDISGQYCGGYATENPPEEDIRQAVEGYFQLRAGEVSGDMKNSDVTVSPLLNDAKEFAAQQREAIGCTICSVETRTAHYAPVRASGDSCTIQVMEVLRIDFTKPDKTMNSSICYIEHTLTLQYQQTDNRYIVVGDLYTQPYGHSCNILDSIN